MCADPLERDEGHFTDLGEFGESDLPTPGEQLHFPLSGWRCDGLGLDEGRLFDPLAGFAALLLSTAGGGRHPVDGHHPQFS